MGIKLDPIILFLFPKKTIEIAGLETLCSSGLSATNHQYLFSQNKPTNNHQPTIRFSHNKSAPGTSQTNRLKMCTKLMNSLLLSYKTLPF
jgi:hypothetical protein